MRKPNITENQAKTLEAASESAFYAFKTAIRIRDSQTIQSAIQITLTLSRCLTDFVGISAIDYTTPKTEPYDRYHLQWSLQFNALDVLLNQSKTRTTIQLPGWGSMQPPQKYDPLSKAFEVLDDINHPKRYTNIRTLAIDFAKKTAYRPLIEVVDYVLENYQSPLDVLTKPEIKEKLEPETLEEFLKENPLFVEQMDKIREKKE